MGIGPCILTKVVCAFFMGDARWVIGWAMVGRAEFAYLGIAERFGVTNGNLRGFPQCHIKPPKNGRGPLLRGYEAHHHPLIRPAIKALFPRGETWHWGGSGPFP